MVRTGECNQCGACCKLVGLAIDNSPASLEWLAARQLDIIVVADNKSLVLVPHICPHLDCDNHCNLHGELKPTVCKTFPTTNLLLPGCGYRFEE